MRKAILLIIYMVTVATSYGVAREESTLTFPADTAALVTDTLALQNDTDSVFPEKKRENCFLRVAKSVIGFFSPEPNTRYIEPQRYNLTAMAQVTNTDDHLMLEGETGTYLSFAPKRNLKVGPYFGWRWIFLGYTFNVNSLNVKHSNVDLNTSIYTPAVSIDFVYRKLGEGYQIKDFKLKDYGNVDYFDGLTTEAIDIDIFSLTAYYSLNSRKYSHQAVFSQTNRQIISAGSWIVGTGYNNCKVSMDWIRFNNELNKRVPDGSSIKDYADSTLLFKTLSYRSIPLTVGYGYNWAFVKHWTLGAQLLGSLSYVWSKGDAYNRKVSIDEIIKDFSFTNFTFDGTLRLGIVWNNSRWFAGANTIYHTYRYHENHLRMSNVFGIVNLYVGFNFWKR